MQYKTVVIQDAPKARAMAAAVEKKSNEMAGLGWTLVTMSITNSAKAILVFGADTLPDTVPDDKDAEAEDEEAEDEAELLHEEDVGEEGQKEAVK